MDWRKQLLLNLDALKAENERQGGCTFEMAVIRVAEIKSLVARGDKGDRWARTVIGSINHWHDMANAAVKDNTWPACCSCGDKMVHGDIYGWVIMVPTVEKSAGMIAAFCGECFELGPEGIARNTLKGIDEFGTLMSLH